jgi:hypothetical protein
LEGAAEIDEIRPKRMRVDRHPRKEPAGIRIGELMHFREIPAVLGDEAGNPGKQPDAVGAGELEKGRGHVGTGNCRKAEVTVPAQFGKIQPLKLPIPL